MAISINEQVMLPTAFIHGTRKEAIMEELKPYGFTPAERAKGARCLFQVVGLEAKDVAPSSNPFRSLLHDLDQWENKWLPIAETVLEVYYPEIQQDVFHSLASEQGLAVIPVVSKFILRVEALEKGSEEQQKAFTHLETRGLKQEIRQEAKTLLCQLLGLETFPTDEEALTQASLLSSSDNDHGKEEPTQEEAYERALDELWKWYREWSQIARKVIRRKDYLITLGLRKRKNRAQKVVDTPPTPSPVPPISE